MTARRFALAALVTLALAVGLTAAPLAKPSTFTPPAEASTLQQTRDAGYFKTEGLCVGCHSRDYITTQPPKRGKEFWAAEVTKMAVVYGAVVPEPDRPTIVEYLAATY
jgi:mono/diheme cytochrome c family protein